MYFCVFSYLSRSFCAFSCLFMSFCLLDAPLVIHSIRVLKIACLIMLTSSSSSIYFQHSINNQFEQKWITKKIKVYSYAKGYQKENNFIELATFNKWKISIVWYKQGANTGQSSDFYLFHWKLTVWTSKNNIQSFSTLLWPYWHSIFYNFIVKSLRKRYKYT